MRNYFSSIKKKLTKKGVVLMYHSVSEPDIDPWELSVSPSNFEQHLQVLKNFKILSVPDIIMDVKRSRLGSNYIALTFDDGYSDNFDKAKPLLEKYHTPATFFITSKIFGEKKLLWWDELAILILRTQRLPENFFIKIRQKTLSYSIAGECMLNEYLEQVHRQWVTPDKPPTKRSTLYYRLWGMMLPLLPDEIESLLKEIKNWASSEESVRHHEASLITEQQLKSLGGHSLFDIGLHTVNHIALSYHSAQVQEQEIIQNQKDLEKTLNRKISTIAYPYGEYNNCTVDVVKKAGLQAAFTVEEKTLTRYSNPFQIGRFQVKNWNGKQLEKKLLEWMKA